MIELAEGAEPPRGDPPPPGDSNLADAPPSGESNLADTPPPGESNLADTPPPGENRLADAEPLLGDPSPPDKNQLADAEPLAGDPSPPGESRLVGADRVLAVLAELARHPAGTGLEEMARVMASPKPTVHRALAALRRAGFAIQDGHGRYLLGDEFLRLAFAHHEARPDHVRVLPILTALAERYGETCHYAILDGPSVVYRSKLDPPAGSVRLSSVVGGRNPAHCTAVGKVLLAALLRTEREVLDWVGDRRLPTPTERSIGTAAQLHAELTRVRERGYGVDDQETDPGVVCLAVPAYLTSPTVPSGAISISSVAYRTPLSRLVDDLPAIRAIVAGVEPAAAGTGGRAAIGHTDTSRSTTASHTDTSRGAARGSTDTSRGAATSHTDTGGGAAAGGTGRQPGPTAGGGPVGRQISTTREAAQ